MDFNPLMKMGGQFYLVLGDLKFSSSSGGGLRLIRGLKFSTVFFGRGEGGWQRVNFFKDCLLISS